MFPQGLYYIAKAFGFLPLTLTFGEPRGQCATLSHASTAYSLVFAIAFTAAQVYVSIRYFDLPLPGQTFATLVTMICIQLTFNVLRVATVYALALRRRRDLIEYINHAQRIRGYIDRWTDETEAPHDQRCRQMIRLKLVVTALQSCMLVAMLGTYWVVYNEGLTVPELVELNVWLVVSAMGGEGVSLVLSGLQFAFMLDILQMMRRLNGHLARCIDASGQIARNTSDRKRSQQYDALNEEIERIIALHAGVTQLRDGFVRLHAVSVLLALINAFVGALTQFFYIFFDLKLMSQSTDDYFPYGELTFDVCGLVFFVIDAYFTVWVGQVVKDEVGATMAVLAKFQGAHDRRLCENISTIFIRLLSRDSAVQVCGMFDLDKTVFYAMGGTFLSYVTILIQFHLAEVK